MTNSDSRRTHQPERAKQQSRPARFEQLPANRSRHSFRSDWLCLSRDGTDASHSESHRLIGRLQNSDVKCFTCQENVMPRPDPRSGLMRVNDADFSFAYPDYSLLHRHTPRKRSIQHAAAFRFHHWQPRNTGSPAFAGADGAVRDAQRIATDRSCLPRRAGAPPDKRCRETASRSPKTSVTVLQEEPMAATSRLLVSAAAGWRSPYRRRGPRPTACRLPARWRWVA
jgi:hypothetical protein